MREKGMIRIGLMQAHWISILNAVATLVNEVMTMLPLEWPPWSDVAEPRLYRRDNGHGEGTSQTWIRIHGMGAHLRSADEQLGVWFDFRGQWVPPNLTLYPPDLFWKFGTKPAREFDRVQWKAGTHDEEKRTAASVNVSALMEQMMNALDPLIIGWWGGTLEDAFFTPRPWNWVTDSGYPETTDEEQPTQVIQTNEPSFSWPLTNPAGMTTVWDANAAEAVARRNASIQILQAALQAANELEVGPTFGGFAKIFHSPGSQTIRRDGWYAENGNVPGGGGRRKPWSPKGDTLHHYPATALLIERWAWWRDIIVTGEGVVGLRSQLFTSQHSAMVAYYARPQQIYWIRREI